MKSQPVSLAVCRLATIKPVGVMRFDWVTRVSLNNLRPLLSFSADLAIDLGTTNRSSSRHGRILRFLMTQARQALSLQSRVRKKRCSADLPS